MNKIIKRITSSALLCTMVAYTVPVFAFTKEETVYSKLDANGNRYSTIVNDHIKNTEQEELINDISDLLNIKNTNGDEEFKVEENNLVWNANGSDIYYQGETQKELPIECNIKYELDGKEISAKDLAGKSGKVKITIKYINKDEHLVNINGKNEKMYTPFVVVCGTIIKNENNKNIEITNGKLIDDGTKTTVIGMSLPGLKESLNTSSDKLEIPDIVEITMDSTEFELNNIVTYVTPKVIEESDLDLFDNIDDVFKKVDTLQNSSKQIEEGANKLNDGATQLSDGANTLSNGIGDAYTGAKTIQQEVKKATNKLTADKSDALDEQTLANIGSSAAKAATLSDEQKTQIASNAEMVVNSTFTEEYKEQIASEAIKAVNSKLSEAEIRAMAEAGIDKQATTIKAGADKQIDQMVAGLEMAGITVPEPVAQGLKKQAEENAIASAKKIAGDTAVQVAKSTAEKVAADTAMQTAKTTASQVAKSTAVATAETVAKTTAEKTSTQVAKQVGNEAKKTFTNQVVAQMGTLGNGLNELTNGLNKLNEGGNTLAKGTENLSEGIETLSTGISKFNREGIDKICNYINGDIKDVKIRIEKLQELSEKYNNFTMLNDGNKGNVKFIMIIDGIKKEETKEQAIIENKEENE